MKKVVILIVGVILKCTFVFGQNIDLEFSMRPYYFDKEVKSFPRILTQPKKYSKFPSDYLGYPLIGESLPIKFHFNEMPKLYIQVVDNIDPVDMLSLFTVKEFKGDKVLILGKMSSGAVYLDNKNGSLPIKLLFKKVKDKVYEISFDQIIPLQKGEYGFLCQEVRNDNSSYRIYPFMVE